MLLAVKYRRIVMILKENTLEILKNFSAINGGIWIDEGNVLKITSKNKCIFGMATVENEFPNSFGIYDLPTLLSIFSLHKSAPEIEFDKYNLIVNGLSGRSKIKYRYCAEEMLVIPPKKEITLPSVDIEFSMNEEDYIWICNAAKILESPNIAIKSDGKKISLCTFDFKNNAAHTDSLEIDENNTGVKYNIIFEFDIWNKMMSGSYNVSIHAKGLSDKNPSNRIAAAMFKHTTKSLQYVLMVHEESTYDV
jgi:hypothetical protein